MTDDHPPATDRKAAAKPRPPRKMTPQRLANIALHYLERYASSAENLRRVLGRRVAKSAYAHPDLDVTEADAWIEDLIKRYIEVDLLNDRVFAEARTRTLLAQGTAPRAIRMKLLQKGVSGEDIDDALEALGEEVVEPELEAALNLARRRRLGPYREPAKREEMREHDLATLARAGFGYGTARRVIETDDVGALEARVRPEITP